MSCKEWEENLTIYLYDELPVEPRTALEAHLALCEGCRATLEQTRRLRQLLDERPAPEPSPEFLFECRQSLQDALDREELGWPGLLRGWLSVVRWAPASGAVAVVTLLALGFSLGWAMRSRAINVSSGPPGLSTASLLPADFQNMRISGISRVAPDPKTGDVRITLDAERRLTLEGSLDDPRIQQVLVYALRSYDNPGIRRDTLDVLRTRPDNPKVQQALLYALRHDSNAGVRLEALDALQGLAGSPGLRQVLLGTLEHDTNPGVRVAAIDLLMRHADEEVLPALERLAASDSNRSVRLKCARAVRELEKGGY
jgi:hypothetical protein